jgi:hypothetical protein
MASLVIAHAYDSDHRLTLIVATTLYRAYL